MDPYRDPALVECVFCHERVPLEQTDLTEHGARCERCTRTGEIAQHIEASAREQAAEVRAEDGVIGAVVGAAIAALIDDD